MSETFSDKATDYSQPIQDGVGRDYGGSRTWRRTAGPLADPESPCSSTTCTSASSVALCSAVGPVLAAISAPLRAKELARGQAAACRAQCPQQNMAPLVSTPCPMIAQLQC